jgi:hypothetical protein
VLEFNLLGANEKSNPFVTLGGDLVRCSRVLGYFTIAVLTVFLTACSNDLSRSNAKSQIEKTFGFETGPGLNVKIGIIGVCNEYSLNPDKDQELQFLRDRGILDVKNVNKRLWQVSLTEKGAQLAKRMQQEPYAKQVENGCDYQLLSLPLVSREMIGVTGIRREGNKSVAEFRWKWVPTEFGRMLFADSPEYKSLTLEQKERLKYVIQLHSEIEHPVTGIDESILLTDFPIEPYRVQTTSTAIFHLYDDGWRLD